MAYFCPYCEPDRRASYGYAPTPPARESLTLAEREERFKAALAAGDVAEALALARAPLPADTPEKRAREWAGRRRLADALKVASLAD